MTRRDLLHTLSGCQFYRTYLDVQTPAKPRIAKPHPKPVRVLPRAVKRQISNRVFRKHGLVMGALTLGSLLLIVLPLWLVHPPYGKACLLSLPPMVLCALSWMGGAWWAWERGPHILMAATMGGMPVRICLVLAWTWLVAPLEGISVFAFVLGMMVYWALFTVPEIVMLLELGQNERVAAVAPHKRTIRKIVGAGERPDAVHVRLHVPHRRVRFLGHRPTNARPA